jgi:hypothetical protein
MFAPEGQENILHFPQSTFFTRVVNRGILGHYVATASLATGVLKPSTTFISSPINQRQTDLQTLLSWMA